MRPTDIVAHLSYAASVTAPVILSGPGVRVSGTFSTPTAAGARFRPFVDSADMPPPSGTALRAEYAGATDQYVFFTRFCFVAEDGDWILEVPRTVERGDRRLSERHRLARATGATFVVKEWPSMPQLVVHDLSIGGLSVLHEPDVHAIASEDLLDGELNLAAEYPVPMCVEVRHVKALGGPRPLLLCGLQISAITTVDRERLSAYLARRLRERG